MLYTRVLQVKCIFLLTCQRTFASDGRILRSPRRRSTIINLTVVGNANHLFLQRKATERRKKFEEKNDAKKQLLIFIINYILYKIFSTLPKIFQIPICRN